MAVVFNITSEIGDIIRFKTEYPVVGVAALQSFVDDTDGETGSVFYNKAFRYSLDGGINFTDFIELTTPNLQTVPITKKSQFIIDYRYTHSGSEPTSDLTFNNISLDGDYEALQYSVYTRNIFSKFFDVNDPNVLGWAINVLEKLYASGILPDYITRNSGDSSSLTEDKDFLDFFNTTTHFFAIIVYYARQFENIGSNEILLPEFIKSLGLFTNTDITTTHLQYLYDNYSDEFKKRGTNAIVDFNNSENIPDGELRRLVNYVDPEEFVFALLEPHTTGWCLSKSSPMMNHTRQCVNMIKGYEKLDGFEDKTKYPSSPSSSILNINADPNYMEILAGSASTINGIYPAAFDINNAIRVTPKQSYEIVLRVKQELDQNEIYFGCKFYDENELEISGYNLLTKTSSSLFFSDNKLPRQSKEYFISGILFDSETDGDLGDTYDVGLNIGYGGHLKTPSTTKYVMPFVYTYNASGATGILTLIDFKLRPLNFNFTLGKMGVKNILYLLYNNASIYSDTYIYNQTKGKLIPYKNNLIDNNFNPRDAIPTKAIPTNGRIYNWYAVNNATFSPTDWGVPIDSDWTTLSSYLATGAGGKMKVNDSNYWLPPNVGATNESGFTALGSGNRVDGTGTFGGSLLSVAFWTSNEVSPGNANVYALASANDVLGVSTKPKSYGGSVRLIYTGSGVPPASVVDIDGNIYNVIQIGTQYWLDRNWTATKLNDGTPIANITSNSEWASLTDMAYCNYNNDKDYVYI
jgi:uncharacterized protein (TIGR02145 family)